MGEVTQEQCTTIALRYRFVVQNLETGEQVLKYEVEPSRTIEIIEDEVAENDETEDNYFVDDVEFLRSLDPKEWKSQDHYAVLGLRTLRYKATDDDLKRAYRKMVLKHHPDKRKALGEEIRPDDDYFTCIKKAYEILGTSLKRRSYDSVDPEFDDAVPSTSDLKKDFFETFSKYFELNARWSEKKDVPLLGDMDTSREDVEKFYSFWYNFESWREFSYLDEEEKEKGQDREERRWIEKQNKVARMKRKKEEMSRIRSLVDMAYNADPRIAKFKQDDKDKKLAAKRAKQSAAQARKEEEERVLKEQRLAKEKAEAAEKARIEAIRQERETQKKALKKERKTFRDTCKANNYYSENAEENLSHMSAMDKICEVLKLVELEDLNKDMKTKGRSAFLDAKKLTETRIEEERKALIESQQKNEAEKAKALKTCVTEWTPDHIQLLVKAVNLFPAGTNQRWEVIANFINQHGVFDEGGHFTARDVLSKAKDLQNTDFSKSNLKVVANKQAYDNFEKERRNVKVVDDVEISKKIENVPVNNASKQNGMHENGESVRKAESSASVKVEVPWTPAEQQLLEQALKTFNASTPDRWDRIAECLPNRTKKDCMRRYKELVEIVRAKKAAQDALKAK